VYYSCKSFSAKYLFAEMLNTWGISSMGQIEKIRDYNFKQEFQKEDKMKVVEGGLWRHKGDAIIVVHYDGMTRPSAVCVDSIGLWVRLYDLPPVMMKETMVSQLSAELGEFIRMDGHFPGYMRVRMQVHFPLKKALVPQLNIKSKGRGCMVIKVKYENVPHFFFTCGCMGHAATNCDEEVHNHEIKFGEDLHTSPPKRSREIMVNQSMSRAVRPIFQGSDYGPRIVGSLGRRSAGLGALGEGTTTSLNRNPMHGEDAVKDLAISVHDVHVKEDPGSDSQEDLLQHRKDRVSFDTNMTTKGESSSNDSCLQIADKLTMTVDRFHSRKFGGKKGESSDKRHVLKVVNPGKAKTKNSSEVFHTGCFEGHGTGRCSVVVE
jgi:hypothetical protein